jgi:hypothetical protein
MAIIRAKMRSLAVCVFHMKQYAPLISYVMDGHGSSGNPFGRRAASPPPRIQEGMFLEHIEIKRKEIEMRQPCVWAEMEEK